MKSTRPQTPMDHLEISRRNGAAMRPNTTSKVGANSSGLVDQAHPVCDHNSVHNCENLSKDGSGLCIMCKGSSCG
ncbi:Uncharacterized protein HZ326_11018 [Fusarium oxysporum f. sp. albedinis]|nr:Uncharacterized protein HZ326_11018 [Fusarium oxysporum f. sp. albedinis]